MQIQHELSDSDSSDEDYECFEDDEMDDEEIIFNEEEIESFSCDL